MTRARIWIVVCLFVLPAFSMLIAAPADGVNLSVTLDPGTNETVLEWTGGQPVFSVYRSAAPTDVNDPGNVRFTTSDREWTDAPPTVPDRRPDAEYVQPCRIFTELGRSIVPGSGGRLPGESVGNCLRLVR